MLAKKLIEITNPVIQTRNVLERLEITNFRCISTSFIDSSPQINVFYGGNGAGKTSVLEAVHYLSLGRSFRRGRAGVVIKDGEKSAVILGILGPTSPFRHRLAVMIERGEITGKVDGEMVHGRAELARCFVTQVIDSKIHFLVDGGPEERRAFLDWGVFHVEPEFFATWRRYRRALEQRNQALRQGLSDGAVCAWDPELIETGERLTIFRRSYLQQLAPKLSKSSADLLDNELVVDLRCGWTATDEEGGLADNLRRSLPHDRVMKNTQVGPHRAELIINWADRRARDRVSRGQEKLAGLAMKLSQTEDFLLRSNKPLCLLVDDLAAELDEHHRKAAWKRILALNTQVFVSALHPSDLPLAGPTTSLFHVEHGGIKPVPLQV